MITTRLRSWLDNIQVGALRRDLTQLSELLRKYGHHGQAAVAEELLTTLDTPSPDYKRLAGIDMWGGSGSVADVYLTQSKTLTEAAQEDRRSFQKALIRIAETMDRLRIGTERSRSTAKMFQEWLDRGLL